MTISRTAAPASCWLLMRTVIRALLRPHLVAPRATRRDVGAHDVGFIISLISVHTPQHAQWAPSPCGGRLGEGVPIVGQVVSTDETNRNEVREIIALSLVGFVPP